MILESVHHIPESTGARNAEERSPSRKAIRYLPRVTIRTHSAKEGFVGG